MNRMAKTAEVLWSPIVQMSGAPNTTLPGGPGNPIVGVTIGGSIGGVFVIVVLVGCMIYCKRKRDRNRNDYTLGQRSPSYSALELPQHNQNDVSIVDPLEKKPYTQLMLPLGAKPKERSKYGVCRYKVKGAATLSGSTRPPKASQSPVRNTQQSKTNADDDYTVIENTQQGIELYNLPSYDLVVAETT